MSEKKKYKNTYLCSEQLKQPFLFEWLQEVSYHQNNHIFHSYQIIIETCYEDTKQTITFWISTETFIHTIYILQFQQPVHRLKMEILMSQCTNETTQTTMDTTLKTTLCIWSANSNLNNQSIGLRQKLWFQHAQMKQLKQPFLRLTTRMFWN